MLTSIIRPASYPSPPKKGKNETYILFLASRIANQACTQLVPPQANLFSNPCPDRRGASLQGENLPTRFQEERKGKERERTGRGKGI